MADANGETGGWDAAKPFPGMPPDTTDRYQVIDTDEGRYWEVTESARDAMLAYLAGAGTLRRCPETRRHYVEVTVIDSTGEHTFSPPRTADDQALIDETVNSYLEEVGLPVQPAGYRWFQRLPDRLTVKEIDEAVHVAIVRSGLPLNHRPAEAVAVVRAALAELYGEP